MRISRLNVLNIVHRPFNSIRELIAYRSNMAAFTSDTSDISMNIKSGGSKRSNNVSYLNMIKLLEM